MQGNVEVQKDSLALCGRIEIQYASVQGTYWAGAAVINGFTAVYLAHKGMSDGQIGLTSSIGLMVSILVQALVANLADAHPRSPLKRIVLALYVLAITFAALAFRLSLPVALLMMVYVCMSAVYKSNNSLLNALFMRYVNAGLPVRYGWPRGVGAAAHAVFAYAIGRVVERFSPDSMLIVFALFALCSLCLVIFLPNPERVAPAAAETKAGAGERAPSYAKMLAHNPTLVLLLLALAVQNAGEIPCYTYLIRIVEPLGGNAATLGVCLLIEGTAEALMMFASALLLKRLKPVYWLLLSAVFFLVRESLFALAPSLGVVYLGSASALFGAGLLGFSSVLFADSIVGPREKVRAQSLILLSRSLGMTAGSFITSAVIDRLGFRVILNAGVVCSAAGLGVMLLCFFSARRRFIGLAAR